MAEGIKIEIVSPEKLLLSEQASSVSVPGTDGYFTVLGEHAPVMTTLRPGFITVTAADGKADSFYVKGGFAEVGEDGLTVLAEQAQHVSEFDRELIQAEITRAQEALAAAESHEEREAAQMLVHSFENLLQEASHFEGQVSL